MVPKERRPGPSLIESLATSFFEFSFFKAVQLLELLFPDRIPLGKTLTPGREPVRFSVKTDLCFPASDISGLKVPPDSGPVAMEVAFMGLIGPSGALPHWYTELGQERIREKDRSFVSFLDIFHHRLLTLFYLAWKRHRLPETYEYGALDKLSQKFLCLIGLGTPHLTGMLGMPLEPLIHCSGLTSRQIPSAVAIERTVEYFFETRVRVSQFLERLLPIDPEDLSRVGFANSRLGEDLVCGGYAWESQTRFRVELGPMDYATFVRFLPSGKELRSLFSMVRYMVGNEYEFEVGLHLKREEVPVCKLGEQTATSPRLGWSTWVKTPGVLHREDPMVVFQHS